MSKDRRSLVLSVDRRIGGLEKKGITKSELVEVDRRIGGLEMNFPNNLTAPNVDRRIGGLESILLASPRWGCC